MAEAFRAGSIDSQFRADTGIDGIGLCFSAGTVSDDCDGCTKGGDVVDTSADPEVIQLRLAFLSGHR